MERIVTILKQAEAGVPFSELIRRVGISEQTFYRWKKQYVRLEVDQIPQLEQPQEENVRLKQLVAELTLDKGMLQDVLAKNLVSSRRLRWSNTCKAAGVVPTSPRDQTKQLKGLERENTKLERLVADLSL